jgi:hypothetical protein
VAFLGGQAAPPPRRRRRGPPAALPPPASATPAALSARGKLNLTGDVPLRAPNDPRMTGAMPLIDERALAAEFELPEDDGSAYAADEVADDDLVEVDDGVGLGRAGRAAADFAADFAMDDRSARAGSAAGEEHADEIAKILTETDVYVKYGLHQKAVDHLRRVFAIDPENVEARERLKDVLLAQGREREAIVELLRLAEVTAAFDSERAEGYLREVLGLDGGNRAALELIDRFGFDLEVGGGPARAASDFSLDPRELGGGAVAPVDDDFALEHVDYGPTTRAPMRADSFDGIDPALFDRAPSAQPIGRAGSPRGRGGEIDSFAPTASDSTRQVAASEVAAQVARSRGDERGDVAMGSPPPFRAPAVPDTWQGDRAPVAAPRSMRDAIDAELADDLADDIDQQVAAELSGRAVMPGTFEATTATTPAYDDGGDDELPFDPEAARAFDMVMRRQASPNDQSTIDGDAPSYVPPATYGDPPYVAPAAYGDSADGATRLGMPPGLMADVEPEPYEGHFGGTTGEGSAYDGYADPPGYAAAPDAPVYSEAPVYDGTIDELAAALEGRPLEDVLEEADDYAAQGLIREAMGFLRALASRHPNHPLVTMRLRDLEAAAGAPGEANGTQTVDVEDLEELAPEERRRDRSVRRRRGGVRRGAAGHRRPPRLGGGQAPPGGGAGEAGRGLRRRHPLRPGPRLQGDGPLRRGGQGVRQVHVDAAPRGPEPDDDRHVPPRAGQPVGGGAPVQGWPPRHRDHRSRAPEPALRDRHQLRGARRSARGRLLLRDGREARPEVPRRGRAHAPPAGRARHRRRGGRDRQLARRRLIADDLRGEHLLRAQHGGRALLDAEALVQPEQAALDRAGAHAEVGGDLVVGQALPQQRQEPRVGDRQAQAARELLGDLPRAGALGDRQLEQQRAGAGQGPGPHPQRQLAVDQPLDRLTVALDLRAQRRQRARQPARHHRQRVAEERPGAGVHVHRAPGRVGHHQRELGVLEHRHQQVDARGRRVGRARRQDGAVQRGERDRRGGQVHRLP